MEQRDVVKRATINHAAVRAPRKPSCFLVMGLFAAISMSLAGCWADVFNTVDDYDTVVTIYDPEYD